MTGAAVLSDRDTGRAVPRRVERLLSRTRARAREPSFWYVQAGVVAVTGMHWVVEAMGLLDRSGGAVASIAHLPVILYLLPVVYAGLRYGVEGGVLTGLSIALLSTPNVLIWHRDHYDWIGEALFVAFIVAVGAAIALPVEREQGQRARAERARHRATVVSRRLALMNDVTSMLVRTADLEHALGEVLHRLIAVLDLETAAVATWVDEAPGPHLDSCHSLDPDACTSVIPTLAEVCPHGPGTEYRLVGADGSGNLIPFEFGGDCRGALFVSRNERLGAGEIQLLTAVGAQVGVALDNARLHQAQQRALQTYLHDITRAQEEERRRIARDLHDIATHELLLVRRDLEDGPADSDTDRSGPGREKARERVADVIGYLRRFSRELRPSVLDPLGLGPALEWLASQTDERTPAKVGALVVGVPRRLGSELELALYRIAEEALRNAEHHARASRIDIVLGFTDGTVTLTIHDDGQGFAVPGPAQGPDRFPRGETQGLGITGMRERATLLGAQLILMSHHGHGTRVHIRVPTPGADRPPEHAPIGPASASAPRLGSDARSRITT
ncbi:MAG TPA: sensor histidine kinase [Nitriliruptorales bacterium]